MDRSSVSDYERLIAGASGEELDRLIDVGAGDTRIGIQRARQRALRRRERTRSENARLDSLMELQCTLHAEGFQVIAGVDEVGRGALAGPVTAAAVILHADVRITELDDSKRLTPEARSRIAAEVLRCSVAHAIAHVPAHVIDVVGIAPATKSAMEIALARLDPRPVHVLTDGHPFGLALPETAITGGDSKVASIAAASNIAKVARDRLMCELARHYGDWGFEINKGYGTAEHLDAISKHGICMVHRRSFSPCAPAPTLF